MSEFGRGYFMMVKKRWFCFHKYYGGLFFRFFGYGLSCVNRKIHKPLFSERMGLRKSLKIGHWSIRFLSAKELK